jgi:hypothetical protein
MEAVEDPETQARQIQRDIERTREEMDQTLTALEQRLAPTELLHRGAETIRERVRSGVTNAVDSLKRHQAPVALAGAIVSASLLAFRPSAADRRRRRSEEDFERAYEVLATAVARAKQQSRVGASKLADQTWQMIQRAGGESREVTRALRREATVHPVGALVLLGALAGAAALGARGLRNGRGHASSLSTSRTDESYGGDVCS